MTESLRGSLSIFLLVAFPVLVFPAILAGAASAEPAPAPVDGGFGAKVELEVVEVDVVVVDRDGRPVSGLGVADFAVAVDGQPVPITQFYAGMEPVAALPAPAPAELAVDPAPMSVPRPQPAASPLVVAVLVDDLSSQPSLRKRALEALGPFLAALPAGSLVTLARHEQDVEVVLPLTADRAEAQLRLASLLDRPGRGGRRRAEEQNALAELVHIHEMYLESPRLEVCGEQEINELRLHADTFARDRRIDAESALRAPAVLAKALAPLPGRRILVYLGGGVDPTPGRRVYEAIPQLCPQAAFESRMLEPNQLDLRASIERGVAGLVTAGVTVFTLDLGGRDLEPSLGAALSYGVQPAANADMEDRWSRQDMLFASAKDTGGEAFLDLARPELIVDEISEQLAAGYSLGFVPDHPPEGGEHRIAVSVRGEGLELRYRRTYRHATHRERAADELKATLVAGGQISVLGASVTVGRIAAREGEKKRFDVSLWLRVPLRELLLVPNDRGEVTGNLHLYLSARDHRDRESPMQAIDVPLTVPVGRVATGDLLYEVKAEMRAGQHRLALRVEDLRSGASDLLDLDVEIQPQG